MVIDESKITPQDIIKNIEELGYKASVAEEGVINFRADKIGADTVLSRIIKLVEEAQSKKAPISAGLLWVMNSILRS